MIIELPQMSVGPKTSAKEKDVHIFRLPRPASSVGQSAAADPITFNAAPLGPVRPTDIVVMDCEPWHYVGGELRAHARAHHDFPETILQLSRKQENRAVWWSEEPFEITEIGPSDLDDAKGPYPFLAQVPLAATTERDRADRRDIFVVRSSVHIPGADNHKYKIVFTIGGDSIDPDMSCNP
jgi:hypothetical protein